MKLIIEISDASYETVKNGTWCGSLYEELKNATPLSESEDCVSRQAVLNLAKFDGRDGLGSIIHAFDVEQLPPVTPAEKVGQWIPVSERLPEENGQYLITVKYKHVNDSYEDVYAEHGEWYDGNWDMLCFGHCGQVETILAWMPLPLPWKGE